MNFENYKLINYFGRTEYEGEVAVTKISVNINKGIFVVTVYKNPHKETLISLLPNYHDKYI